MSDNDQTNIFRSVEWEPYQPINKGNKMKNPTTKIWTKKATQKILTTLRKLGYDVEKIDSGYCVNHPNGDQVLKAMNGNNGYLVRYDGKLFKTS